MEVLIKGDGKEGGVSEVLEDVLEKGAVVDGGVGGGRYRLIEGKLVSQ